jgi:hypothetical protein
MRRPRIIRLQILFLFLAIALVLLRLADGPNRPPGFIVFAEVSPLRLNHDAFALEHQTVVTVDAEGSFERAPATAGETVPLAAYAWIFHRESRSVIWQMSPENATPGRGTRAYAQETLNLPAGTYDVYFTTYGNALGAERDPSLWQRIFNQNQHWRNDNWSLALRSASDVQRLDDRSDDYASSDGNVFWTSGPVPNRREVEHLFELTRPTTLQVYSVGELGGSGGDYAWIEDVLSRERRWEMNMDNTVHAGGVAENRLFKGSIMLQPGIYRAVYQTDGDHAYQGWRANPPFDPMGWGLTIFYTNPADSMWAQAFDPWRSRQPLVALAEVSPDRRKTAQVEVHRATPVFVYAVGEMVNDEPYDWGWIEDENGERIWEMDEDRARHAGGAGKNRFETSFLTLEPGTYTLVYETDDSHAYGDWNDDQPDYPERWGLTLFPVSASLPSGAVEVISEQTLVKADEEWVPPSPSLIIDLPQGYRLDWTRLTNETHREITLDLSEETRFHIRALGEFSGDDPMDYGWIESAETGEHVWEMTWGNTEPAGGGERNRRFDGIVNLQPGRYVIHFQTDESYAYGDFGGSAPDEQEAWGLILNKVE